MDYYDDNFGCWDIEDEETREFYFFAQNRSVEKECSICGEIVRILPQYDKCNSCCENIERGIEY